MDHLVLPVAILERQNLKGTTVKDMVAQSEIHSVALATIAQRLSSNSSIRNYKQLTRFKSHGHLIESNESCKKMVVLASSSKLRNRAST
eukprot:6473526-Amphidinium_carterae.1